MKKTYVKPEIQLIEFTLNQAIASSTCAAQMYNHAKDSCDKLPPFDMPGIEFTFGETENCSTPIVGYCYFTSTNMLFSS